MACPPTPQQPLAVEESAAIQDRLADQQLKFAGLFVWVVFVFGLFGFVFLWFCVFVFCLFLVCCFFVSFCALAMTL